MSYLASRIRPGAATMLTAVIAFAVVAQLLVKDGHGRPSVAFTGGVLSLQTRR